MRLVDSIDAVKKLLKSKHLDLEKGSNRDEGIKKLAKSLGVSAYWLGENLKLDREAPEDKSKKRGLKMVKRGGLSVWDYDDLPYYIIKILEFKHGGIYEKLIKNLKRTTSFRFYKGEIKTNAKKNKRQTRNTRKGGIRSRD